MIGNQVNVELGHRISEIRKGKGLTQEEVAKTIGISRTALTQLELGKRGIDVFELKALSSMLGFSVDALFVNESVLNEERAVYERITTKQKEVRISVPKLQVEKFRNVLLYILERCAGKPNVGETVLYKLLYFSDFNYYELYEEHLTGAKYRKLPYGPVPQKLDTIIGQMMEKGMIQRIKTEYYDKMQTRYIPLAKADLTELKASEKEVIDKVIEQLSDWSAAAISNYSHKDMPWLASKEGEEINYELALYRDAPFSVRNYGDEIEEQ